jgi:RNA-directed DNA polymerase
VSSPCLLNVALHGLEEAAGVGYRAHGTRPGGTRRGSPVAVRYADDVVVLCHGQQQAGHVKARLAEWLAPRGLAFNEDKTKIAHLSEGFDFLGFSIRRYPSRMLLIKPSEAAIRRVRERLASELRTLRGGNAMAVIAALNPVIRGWAAYYRGVVSSRLFGSLDDYVWKLTCKWAAWRHNNKPKRWIAGQYFGKSASSGTATGYSATATAAPAWSSSPGRPSNGTCRSRARHPPVTPPWPATGPNGGRR